MNVKDWKKEMLRGFYRHDVNNLSKILKFKKDNKLHNEEFPAYIEYYKDYKIKFINIIQIIKYIVE